MLPCWILQSQEVCFVHLGKYGDIMIMLPAFKQVAQQLGKPVMCVVSKDYASIFDGVSYVKPWVMQLHWWKGVKTAREAAINAGYKPIVVKWWDEPGATAPAALPGARNIRLKIHGRLVDVPASEWDSFQASQWRYAGFTVEQMMEWPLVFDRRSQQRELDLCRRYMPKRAPYVLVNLNDSGTSPFKHRVQVQNAMRSLNVDMVDLSSVNAYRIYDLLGLYDRAAALVTSDTATLHLANASKIPYIAFVNNGGAGSIPRGNCVLNIRYANVMQQMPKFISTLKGLCRST